VSQSDQAYDIIGDVHGQARELTSLLKDLGYSDETGVWRHPERKVIFLGDFIDRGPFQREVVDIAKGMVDAGEALAVMGNHEFNAIAFYTDRGDGTYLRKRNNKHVSQHRAFLDQFAKDLNEEDPWGTAIAWFKTLPMWLDLGNLRIVHACWSQNAIDYLELNHQGPVLTDDLLVKASTKGTDEYDHIEVLLKGLEIPLPGDASFNDKDGFERKNIRVRWWDAEADTYQKAFLGPESVVPLIPDLPIAQGRGQIYSKDAPPVFIGHYWREELELFAHNIACTDYSVAKPGGMLAAYRWDGEQTLDIAKFKTAVRL